MSRARLFVAPIIGLLTVGWAYADVPAAPIYQQALWGKPDERAGALKALDGLEASKTNLALLEQIVRKGPKREGLKPGELELAVKLEDGRSLGLIAQLPAGFNPDRRYPLMIAIGGGPPPDEKGARARGRQMFRFWSKLADRSGWILVAVEDIVSVRKPGKQLRYHMLGIEHMRLILGLLRRRLPIDPDRIHVTGISLGANYAIAYAAAQPDWFAGIMPVSVEGESREHVVRNLAHVNVFTLEGAKDKNIRTIEGPRKMARILAKFGYRQTYEEDAKRGHEGFFHRYPDALKWLLEKPRPAFPKEILRCAHAGMILPGPRLYWLEADTRQAFFAGKVKGNDITINAARARRLTLHLADKLVDLDKPVRIVVNGKQVFMGKVKRSLRTAVEDALGHQDSERIACAKIAVNVADLAAGETWLASLEPKEKPAELPYWEHFAITTLKEERKPPRMKLELVELPDSKGLAGARYLGGAPKQLKEGDVLLQFNGEPFFTQGDSFAFMQHYWWRMPEPGFKLKVLREGKVIEVTLPLP